jgi:hypothetical protein
MAYTSRNFKTKADLKRALAAGDKITVYQPNQMFASAEPPKNGTVYLEGPHYPQPHRWYAQAEMADGYIVKVK